MASLSERDATIDVLRRCAKIAQCHSPPQDAPSGFNDAYRDFFEGRLFMTPMWPCGWRTANDSTIAGRVGVTTMPGFMRDGEFVRRADMQGGR